MLVLLLLTLGVGCAASSDAEEDQTSPAAYDAMPPATNAPPGADATTPPAANATTVPGANTTTLQTADATTVPGANTTTLQTADETRPHATVPAVGSYEIGLQTAYSFGISKNAQMVTFFPRVGRVMKILDGPVPGVLTFGIEGMFSRIYETSDAMELGGGLLLRYRMLFRYVQPYAELEGGMLYEGLRHFFLGSNVLFTCQGAVGLQIPLSEKLGVTAGYRFRHISNAGQSPSNPGLNSNLLAAGIAYAF
jgi:lipid A 3-O-deacylase